MHLQSTSFGYRVEELWGFEIVVVRDLRPTLIPDSQRVLIL